MLQYMAILLNNISVPRKTLYPLLSLPPDELIKLCMCRETLVILVEPREILRNPGNHLRRLGRP